MTMTARAFSPAGISSFFEICDRTSDGTAISDPEQIGARGGGFAINKGVLTQVSLVEAKEEQTRVFIDNTLWPEAETTRSVVEKLLEKVRESYHVTVRHRVDVPIGAGFGSSAAGALGVGLALDQALDLHLTCNQLGRIAHVAEVKCLTGLGTVSPLMLGGCVLTIEPGAPGTAIIDRIPVSPDHRIVAGTYRSYPTKDVLSSLEKREAINECGQKTLEKILGDPSLKNFMRACKEFAIETGFITSRVRELIELAERAGAIGATQNMLGEAVHALVTVEKVKDVFQVFSKVMPSKNITIARIDLQGPRRLE